MPKKDVKSALGASLKAEEQAVRNRFDKAEAVFSKKKSAPPPQEQPPRNGAGKVIRDSFTIPDGEYALISSIRKRCMKAGVSANKSEDRKSTRLNSSHANISYAVFCLKKKTK